MPIISSLTFVLWKSIIYLGCQKSSLPRENQSHRNRLLCHRRKKSIVCLSKLLPISSSLEAVDFFTKPIPPTAFNTLYFKLGMKNIFWEELRKFLFSFWILVSYSFFLFSAFSFFRRTCFLFQFCSFLLFFVVHFFWYWLVISAFFDWLLLYLILLVLNVSIFFLIHPQRFFFPLLLLFIYILFCVCKIIS